MARIWGIPARDRGLNYSNYLLQAYRNKAEPTTKPRGAALRQFSDNIVRTQSLIVSLDYVKAFQQLACRPHVATLP